MGVASGSDCPYFVTSQLQSMDNLIPASSTELEATASQDALVVAPNLSTSVADPETGGQLKQVCPPGSCGSLGTRNNICVDSTGKFLKSDHYPVTADIFSISIHTNTHPPNQPAPLNYLKADLPQLAYHLSLDIETFTQTLGNSPIVWEDLKYVILNCCECFIPRAKIPSKPSPRWFNSSIRHQLNRTRTLKRRVKKRPTLHMQDKLTTAELTLQTAMLEAKENYLSTLVGSFKTQPKKLYGYLNSLTESKYKPQSIVHNNQIVRDPRQKAELFNKFFNSTFTKSNFKLPPVSSLQVPTIQLSSISFTELEVYEALAQLDPQKAMGCDMISPLVLKLCADTLAQPLHSFFSTCIELGTIPQEWKIHKICPQIPKSGNLLEVKNYRPISLLSIVSKVLERIIFNKIIDFLRPKFSKQQFGFKKKQIIPLPATIFLCLYTRRDR